MKYLLDTNTAGKLIDGKSGVADRVEKEMRQGSVVGICVPVLGELYYGIANSNRILDRKKLLARRLAGIKIWPYTNIAAECFGDLCATLRRKGRPIQQIDMQIAAIALTLDNCILITLDTDFTAVDGLKTENWTVAAVV